jgi:hypothetical protein
VTGFIVDARRDGDILLDPGGMWDDGEINGREEVSMEMTTLSIVPSKSLFLFTHEVVHQIALRGPKKTVRVCFISDITMFFCIMTGWLKWWGFGSRVNQFWLEGCQKYCG